MQPSRTFLALVHGGVALPLVAAALIAQIPEYRGPEFTRTEVAPGVHAFVFDNPLGDKANVDGTAVAIINAHDVVVVDAQWTPATARRVIAEIRILTPNPVRYVVTTHWHGDHWFGNRAYRDAFPDVEFVAHANTRTDAAAQEVPDIRPMGDSVIPGMIADFEKRYAGGVRRDGKPYTATDSANARSLIGIWRWALPATKEIEPVLPTLTISDSLVLHRGDRTIVIRHLGRGNTRGDLTVWLPKERVLVTGDLLVNPAPYSFGSYPGEWVKVLTSLRSLPATVVIPGHGAIQRDWAYLDLVVDLINSTRTQASAAVAKQLNLEATRKAVNLASFRERFTGGDETIGRAFDGFFVAPAVERAWLEARGELDTPVKK